MHGIDAPGITNPKVSKLSDQIQSEMHCRDASGDLLETTDILLDTIEKRGEK